MCMASPFVWSCCASAHKRSESPCLPYRVEAHFGFRQAWESLTHSLPYFSYSFLLFHWQLLTQGLTLTNSFSLLLTSYILTSPYWLTSYSLLLTFYSLLAYFSLLTPYFLLLLLILQKSRKSKTISERVQQLKPICIPMYIKEIDPQHP